MHNPRFLSFANHYFWYFAMVGLLVPFTGIFLDDLGFSSKQIGELLALATLAKVIGPFIFAPIADKTGQLRKLIVIAAILALLSFSLLYYWQNYWLVVLVFALFTLFSAGLLPQLEVFTQSSFRRNPKIYGRIRLWGSVGFIVISVLSGKVIELWGAQSFITIGVLLSALLVFASLLLPVQRKQLMPSYAQSAPMKQNLLSLAVVIFVVAGLLLQVSFGAFYGFFALYLKDFSYSEQTIGLLMALGVIAEIIIFIYAGTIFRYFSVKQVLVASLVLTAIRWCLLALFPESLFIVAFTQVLHAASFGLNHSACLVFLQQHFVASQQARAQALYVGIVYGVGGTIGAYFAGNLWQDGIGAQATWLYSALFAGISAVIFGFLPNQQGINRGINNSN